MRVIATTVVRESIRGKQRTGYVYDVDWESQTVRRQLPVPDPRYPESDDNPRGGVRGGRGVAVTPAGVVVANYDTLSRYDDDWNLVDAFSHPLFVGLHEITWDGEHLWVTATSIDAVLKVGLDNTVEVAWDPHAPDVADQLRLRKRPHPVDGTVDYRRREAPKLDSCHINSVSRDTGVTVVGCGLVRRQRGTLARFSRRAMARARRLVHVSEEPRGERRRRSARSLVVQLNGAGPAEILVELTGVDFPHHNGCLLDEERVAVNDSTNNRLRIFTAGGGELQNLAVPGRWLRGLARVDERRVLVGTAPATIVLVNLERNEMEGSLQLSEDPNEAVHGLTIDRRGSADDGRDPAG
jgi:hypothetical protein